MNCPAWEEPIALWVEGDLDDAGGLAEHLADCANCRRFTEELRASQAALHGLDALPVSSVAERVMARVARRRLSLRRLGWAASLAPAVSLLLVFFLTRLPDVERLPAPAGLAPLTPALPRPAAQAIGPRERAPRTPTPRAAEARETEFIHLMTDDDDVVILWIADTKGDGR